MSITTRRRKRGKMVTKWANQIEKRMRGEEGVVERRKRGVVIGVGYSSLYLGPYLDNNTGTRPISEVKYLRAGLVRWWETTLEVLVSQTTFAFVAPPLCFALVRKNLNQSNSNRFIIWYRITVPIIITVQALASYYHIRTDSGLRTLILHIFIS